MRKQIKRMPENNHTLCGKTVPCAIEMMIKSFLDDDNKEIKWTIIFGHSNVNSKKSSNK